MTSNGNSSFKIEFKLKINDKLSNKLLEIERKSPICNPNNDLIHNSKVYNRCYIGFSLNYFIAGHSLKYILGTEHH